MNTVTFASSQLRIRRHQEALKPVPNFTLGCLCHPHGHTITPDDLSTSLNVVACSSGANGLIIRSFATFGSLLTYPLVGGAKLSLDGTHQIADLVGTRRTLQREELMIDHAADSLSLPRRL
jgi:hypothetical protein